jgi:GNAT superfamily N-acetyltransferase
MNAPPSAPVPDAGPTPVVRAAEDSDAAGLVALVGSCFSEYEGCVLETEHEMPHLLRAASHFAGVGGRAWVAVVDGSVVDGTVVHGSGVNGSVVGSVACRPATDAGGLELQMLYVLRPWRRRGLGARFVGLVEGEARRRGARFVELWSDTRFTDAHRLYRTLGYEQLPDVRELHDLSATREYRFARALEPS